MTLNTNPISRSLSAVVVTLTLIFANIAEAQFKHEMRTPPMDANVLPGGHHQEPGPNEAVGSSGGARLSIPIQVPPGPGGYVPSLALAYSSHSGDSQYGVGWSLNVGEIRCTARFGVPDYSACPRYEIDGQVMTEDPLNAGRFHDFVEKFRRIEYDAANDLWTVTTLDGEERRYGSSDNSRIYVDGDITKPVAHWLLDQTTQPTSGGGNVISYFYDRDPDDLADSDPDVGIAYLSEVSYSAGLKRVRFVYEPRPDVLFDFPGGIERRLTHRLIEVETEVSVAGSYEIFQRRVFRYSEPGEYTTDRSRLTWTQLFGTDCPLTQTDPAEVDPTFAGTCTSLPKTEYVYTDPSDVLTSTTASSSQWDHNTSASGYLPPNLATETSADWEFGSPVLFGDSIRFGDVNGDGLTDYIDAGGWGPGYPGDNSDAYASVYLNNGTNWVWDQALSQKLDDLTFQTPVMSVWAVNRAVCSVTITHEPEPVGFGHRSDGWAGGPGNNMVGRPYIWHSDYKVRLKGSFELLDINADGLADLVMSIKLSGIHRTHDCDGTELPSPEWVEGETVRVVLRNTGDGWVDDSDPTTNADSELEANLPPFGIVAVEGFDYLRDTSPMLSYAPTTCRHFGLMPGGNDLEQYPTDYLCINSVFLDAQFPDLNGDSKPDVVVLTPDDPNNPMVHSSSGWGPPAGTTPLSSRAWIQGDGGWEAAPEFDLPLPHAYINHGWSYGLRYPNKVTAYPMSTGSAPPARLVDLNRDGYTDLISPHVVLLNQGRSGTTNSAWCASHASTSISHPTINVRICPEAMRFRLPTAPDEDGSAGAGQGFSRYSAIDAGQTYAEESSGSWMVDVNGDGWLDIVVATSAGEEFYDFYPQLSYPTIMETWLFSPAEPNNPWKRHDDARFDPPVNTTMIYADHGPCACQFHPPGVQIIDVNGDGAADFVQGKDWTPWNFGNLHNYINPSPWNRASWISKTSHPDLIREVRNGLGGVVQYEYESGASLRNEELESMAIADAVSHQESADPANGGATLRWTSKPLVSKLTISGPNQVPIDHEFEYGYPLWCPHHQSSLGFRVIRRTQEDDSTVDQFFRQRHGIAGASSSEIIADGGGTVVSHEQTVWELVNQVGSLPVPGSISHDEVHLGRTKQSCKSNNFVAGATPNGCNDGWEFRSFFQYDDAYGFNFVDYSSQSSSTRFLGTHLTPLPPTASHQQSWIMGLVQESWQVDATKQTSKTLSRVRFTFDDEGRVRTEKHIDHARSTHWGDDGSVTQYDYDGFGNLRSSTEALGVAGKERTVSFCFDGDTDDWCPELTSPVQNSHSVLVASKDALGNVTSSIPDPITGKVLESTSDYSDQPDARIEYDAFARAIASFVTPNGGVEILQAESFYDFQSLPPTVAQKIYTDEVGSEFVRFGTVLDGFGRTWKSIAETPTGFVGTASFKELSPAGRVRTRETLPFDCDGDPWCTALVGDIEPFAVRIESDALGRPIRVDDPDGQSLMRYLPVTRTQPTGNGPGDEFLAVMTRNGKGDIIERVLDGDKVVWVDECSNVAAVVSPVLDDIGSEPCSTPDSSFYSYEADGKVSTIFDAIATNANDNFDDVNRFLRYKYDTLGRVISIEDPNYDGALSTKITFDEIGNLHTTTNARGQTRTSEYDALGRLESISSDVAGEETFNVSYRNDDESGVIELQAGREWSDYYSRKYVYDDLGRLRRNELKVDVGGAWTAFLTDYEFDQAGRPLQITYPDTSTQIAYEYDKGYLQRVCDLGGAADCTEADGATNYVDGVVYDELGRREEVSWTGGARSFAYNGTTHRLSEDHFEGNGPSAYLFERNVAEYDAVGNIKVVTGLSSMPDVAVGESYDYDNRNRLIKWTKDEVSGATVQDYGYDDLGNLVDHAGDTQSFTQAEFPHAIASRNAEATSYAYDPDGNVQSILDPGTNQYFNFNSANQLVCIGSSESSPGVSSCDQNVFRYDIRGKRLIDHRPLGSLNYQIFVDDSYSYVRYPAAILASVEIFAFGERIANKEIPSASLRSASLWPIGIGPGFLTGASAVLGFWLLSWAWDRRMLILVVRQPVRGTVAVTVTLSLFFYVPVAWAGGGGGAVPIHRWELSNAVGTGMVLLDQAGERIRTTFRTPFGREHQVAGSMFGLRNYYGGHRVHDSSGLVYMNARWQDPGSGTFMSVDPVVSNRADPQSYNAYAYVRNNPVNFDDPTGMCICTGMWSTEGGGDNSGTGSSSSSATYGVESGTVKVSQTHGKTSVNASSPEALEEFKLELSATAKSLGRGDLFTKAEASLGGGSGAQVEAGSRGSQGGAAAATAAASGILDLQALHQLAKDANASVSGILGGGFGLAGFGAVTVDANGNMTLDLGIGVGAGEMSVISATAQGELQGGDMGAARLEFVAGGAVGLGALQRSSVSLTSPGAAAGGGFLAGQGGFVFMGFTMAIPLGNVVEYAREE